MYIDTQRIKLTYRHETQCDRRMDERLYDVQEEDVGETNNAEFSFSGAMVISPFEICFLDVNFTHCL